MKKRVNVHDIKQALLDERFREMLPEILKDDIQKFLQNPGCACNHPIYLKVMKQASKELAAYFPTKDTPEETEVQKEFERLTKNEWQVINCSVHELTDELRKLGPGRKQLDVARWQDQVTVVINHLEGIY